MQHGISHCWRVCRSSWSACPQRGWSIMSWLIRRTIFSIGVWVCSASLAWAQFSDEFDDLPPVKPPVRTLPSLPPSGGASTNSTSPSSPAASQTDQRKNVTPPRSGSQELPTPLPPMEGEISLPLNVEGPKTSFPPVSNLKIRFPVSVARSKVFVIFPLKKLVSSISHWMAALRLILQC